MTVNHPQPETTKRSNNGSKITRRKLLEYTLAGVGTAALVSAGYYLTRPNNPPIPDFEHTILRSEAEADFDYTGSKLDLKYMNPTSEEVIKFFAKSEDPSLSCSWYVDGRIAARTKEFSTKLPVGERKIKLTIDDTLELSNTSRDPDILDYLTYRWSVDGQEVSTDKDYSRRLPTGEHKVGLCASDRKQERCVQKIVTMPESQGRSEVIEVEPDQLYPQSKLNVGIKGVVYLGEIGKNDMSLIKDELGCNGIRLVSLVGVPPYAYSLTADINMIGRSLKIALENDISNFSICPRFMGWSLEDTKHGVREFAKRLDELGKQSDAIVFQVGNELSIDIHGICKSGTYEERRNEFDQHSLPSSSDVKVYQKKLEDFLKDLVAVSRESYHGRLSYAAHPGEWGIGWDELDFDIVGQNQYWWPECTDHEFVHILKQRKTYGKPVHITEFGCATYEGAFKLGGRADLHPDIYNEDAQAEGYKYYLDLFNRGDIDGCFAWVFRDYTGNSATRFSLVDVRHRKKSFYMYKSYERSS